MAQNEGVSGTDFNISGLRTGGAAGKGKGKPKGGKRKFQDLNVQSVAC